MFSSRCTLAAFALVLATMAGCSPKEEAKPPASANTDSATMEKKEEPKTPSISEVKPADNAKGEKPVEAKKEEPATKGGAEKYVTTPSGLKYAVIKEGKGGKLQRNQVAMVHYRGTMEDGTEFDSSYKTNEPIPVHVGVGEVIKGWDEALLSMRVGDKRKLIIPGPLAYPEGRPPIPPGATLLFDIEVVGVKTE